MALRTTGYQSAAVTVTWASGQDLDSLADNGWTDLSDVVDNTTNKYVMVDIELVLASAAYTGADSTFEIFIIPSVDGTNYGDWTGGVTTPQQQNQPYLRASLPTSGTTAGQRLVYERVPVPPGLYRYAARNLSGVTTPGTGNSLKWRPHSHEDA